MTLHLYHTFGPVFLPQGQFSLKECFLLSIFFFFRKLFFWQKIATKYAFANLFFIAKFTSTGKYYFFPTQSLHMSENYIDYKVHEGFKWFPPLEFLNCLYPNSRQLSTNVDSIKLFLFNYKLGISPSLVLENSKIFCPWAYLQFFY